jgi:urease accessory protein
MTAQTSPGSATALLLLADGRLPAGGHAHSGGLEAAIGAGRVTDLPTLATFLRGRLHTTGRTTAAFTAATCAARTSATPAGRVWELDAGVEVRTASPALRRASRSQGRALLRAGRAMWRVDPAYRDLHQPVALGVLAAAAGLGPVEAAVAGAYGTVTGPASAAVRLLALDPYAVHALLAELAGECDRLAAEAAERIAEPVDALPADSAPLLEIGAEDHDTWEVRLFAS